MTWAALALSVIVGYLLGGMPFPYWLGKLKGVDLFATGTRNPGAANLFRMVSPPLGVLAVFLDIGKGAAAVGVGTWLGLTDGWVLAGGASAIMGHWHSSFLRFRGGEALATCVGVALGAAPFPTLIVVAGGLPLLASLRNTGVAAGVCWLLFVPIALALNASAATVIGVFALGLLIALRSKIRAGRLRRPFP